MNRPVALIVVISLVLAVPLVPASLTARAQPTPVTAEIPRPAAGVSCTVHFRRDALGMASRTIVPPDTSVAGEARTSLTGTFRHMDADWIVISRPKEEDRLTWIARDAVLTIEATVP